MQRRSQAAGELRESGVQLVRVGGVDHAQDRLGLGHVDASGHKRPQREFSGFGGPAPAAQTVRSRVSTSGGEPSTWASATGWPV